MGLVVCVGEVLGGALINIGAGALVDRAGGDLSVALWVQVVCGVIGGVLCLFLIETAPVKTRAGAAQPVAARAA